MTQILIIDDSAYQRGKIQRALKATNYELLEAAHGREGLEMIIAHTPDCILTDLVMPEMNGLEMLEILQEQGSSVPVIVLTADIQKSTKQRCLELGAVAMINKPLRENDLVNTIKQVLSALEK
ncbi:MAG: response regulator [Chloroflexi bacterium]|nr:response regulator [Chloroflexota bacterium]